VDSGDVLALFSGIAIVIFVEIRANPRNLYRVQIPQEGLVKPVKNDIQSPVSVNVDL